MRQFHRPVTFSTEIFQSFVGGADPAELEAAAHTTARIILERGRAEEDPEVVRRLIALADSEGIETLAELWAGCPADSLPGALWRLYALRDGIRRQPQTMALLFRLGSEHTGSAEAIAGVAQPPGPEEVKAMADEILAGAYRSDLDMALLRAAAFAQIISVGRAHLPPAYSADSGERESRERAAQGSALRLARTAEELVQASRLERAGELH